MNCPEGPFDRVLAIVRWTLLLRIAALMIALATLPLRTTLPPLLSRAFAVWGCLLLVYNAALLLWRARATALLHRRPYLLLVDLCLSLAVMQLGGGWRSSYFVYTLTTTVVFSVLLKRRGTIVATVALMLGAILKDPSPGVPAMAAFSAGEWDMRLGAGLFYVTAGLILGYVVALIDRVESLSRADVQRAQALSALHEQRRLSLELHDGAKQIVTAMLLRLKPLVDRRDRTVEEVHDELYWLWRAVNYLQSELSQVMQTLGDRSESGVPPCDVATVAREEARISSDITGLSWTVCATDDEIAVPADQNVPLRRFLSEALMNVAKHSGVRAGTVKLASGRGETTIAVCDDGRGFCYDKMAESTTTGLRSLHRRAEQLNGSLTIDTALGKGCKIILTMASNDTSHGAEGAPEGAHDQAPRRTTG